MLEKVPKVNRERVLEFVMKPSAIAARANKNATRDASHIVLPVVKTDLILFDENPQ